MIELGPHRKSLRPHRAWAFNRWAWSAMLDARLPQWRGRDRFLSIIAGGSVPRSLRQPVDVSWGPGLRAIIDPSADGSLAALYRTQWVRPALLPVLEACLRNGGTFVDVGANIGLYATWASRLVGPSGHVVAFEPVPATRAVLAEIAASNELTNLEIVPLALGVTDGQAFINVTPGASGRSRIVNSQRTDLVVQVATLDHCVAERTPALIKVDVEGLEFDVLQGGQGTLKRTRCPVVFESPAGLGASSTLQIVEFLTSLDYEVFSIDWSGLTPFNPTSYSHNLLALHAQDTVSKNNLDGVRIPRNQNN